MGLALTNGCLSLTGGCLPLGACDDNTNPCATPCCQYLLANCITRRDHPTASFSDDGTYYETDTIFAFTDLPGVAQCPTVPITLTAGGLWQWVNLEDVDGLLFASGSLTSTVPHLPCPPIDHTADGWDWTSDPAGFVPDPTLKLMTMDCEAANDALALPATDGTLTVAGLIGDFTSSFASTVSPIDPAWDGTLVWDAGGSQFVPPNRDPMTNQNAVQQADGTWINGVTIQMFMVSVGSGFGSSISLSVGLVGDFSRKGGRWYDPMGVATNAWTLKGRMHITLGVAP